MKQPTTPPAHGQFVSTKLPTLANWATIVGVSSVIVGIPVPNDPDPVADRTVKVPLSLLARVEPLSPEAVAQPR